MKVQFIKHSGFALESEAAAMVFDYYKGEIPEFDSEVPVYVFVSHAHSDHFNPEIVDKMKKYPKVTFIMSSDIPADEREKMAQKAPERKFIYMDPDCQEEFPGFRVRTLKSTDEGVAFILETAEKKSIMPGTCTGGPGSAKRMKPRKP